MKAVYAYLQIMTNITCLLQELHILSSDFPGSVLASLAMSKYSTSVPGAMQWGTTRITLIFKMFMQLGYLNFTVR